MKQKGRGRMKSVSFWLELCIFFLPLYNEPAGSWAIGFQAIHQLFGLRLSYNWLYWFSNLQMADHGISWPPWPCEPVPINTHTYTPCWFCFTLLAQRSRICLQCRRPGFNLWDRKIPWSRKWQDHSSILAWRIPWIEESVGLYTVHGVAKSQTWLSD